VNTTAPDRTLFGIALMLGFCAVAPVIDVFSILASRQLPVGQVSTARYVVQSVVLLVVLFAFRIPFGWDRKRLPALFLAAALSLGSTFTFVAAIKVVPLAEALAIVFVEPFILLLIGRFIFRHEIGWRRLGAAIVGFIGVLMIIQPTFKEVGAVALLPLGTALCFALYMLEMRRMSQSLHPVALQLQLALAASLIAVPILVLFQDAGIPDLELAWPAGIGWVWVLSIGASSSVSHLLLTNALKNATATVLAPLHYLELVSATAFGYFVFSHFPNGLKLIGIAVVIASGLYVIHRERLAKAQVQQPANPQLE
jgi:drug/metabolite transporter (DMT)-like permease